jgi:PRTRC genetic system ThiF family protein
VVAVVGCGGTGGFVAEGLCRLPAMQNRKLILIDHDRVEPRNLGRQAFYPGDVGKFKSQALAERLSQSFGREIGYSVYPFGQFRSQQLQIIIGCVDNAAARQSMNDAIKTYANWWIDSGNGRHSGQVLIGNEGSLHRFDHACFKDNEALRIPSPALQQPALLTPVAAPAVPRDCAQAVLDDEQSPVINQAIATLVLECVNRLLSGTLDWMAAYLDLEAGTLSTVPATPEKVARIIGVAVDNVIEKPPAPPKKRGRPKKARGVRP